MASRERILAAVRREPVDYVPCLGSFNPLTPVQRRGHTWNFPWPETASQEEQLRYQTEVLGLDELVHVSVAVTRPAPGVEASTRLDGDVLHKTYHTPAGDLHAAVRYNDLWPHGLDIPFYSDFNIGHFVEPWLKTMQDLDCLKQVQALRPVDELVAEAQRSLAGPKALAAKYGLAVKGSAGLGLTGAQHLFGAVELCLLTIDQPDLVDAYLEHEHRLNLRQIEAYAEVGGVDIVGRNGFYETADFYGPAALDRFLTRRLTAEAEAAHRAGMVVAYTIHTGVMPILDYLAALPLDSLQGIDIAFRDTDIRLVRDRLPGKAHWTGPSSTFHIWKGPEATRQAVRQVFDCFGKRGLILSQCVSSHSIMPWESTAAMIDEWRRLR
jgi:hypothetical protein